MSVRNYWLKSTFSVRHRLRTFYWTWRICKLDRKTTHRTWTHSFLTSHFSYFIYVTTFLHLTTSWFLVALKVLGRTIQQQLSVYVVVISHTFFMCHNIKCWPLTTFWSPIIHSQQKKVTSSTRVLQVVTCRIQWIQIEPLWMKEHLNPFSKSLCPHLSSCVEESGVKQKQVRTSVHVLFLRVLLSPFHHHSSYLLHSLL